MTGKTYTNQDLTLGGVVLQQLPLRAMLPTDKQTLINNKTLSRDLLALAFTQLQELTEAMQAVSEYRVWSSEWLVSDPYADDDEIDAAELWVKIRFDGLKPYITLLLREVTGVYNNSYKVVEEWARDEVDLDYYIDTEAVKSTLLASSVFSGIWSICGNLADVVHACKDVLDTTLRVTDYERPKRVYGNEDSYDYVVQTVEGAIRFHT